MTKVKNFSHLKSPVFTIIICLVFLITACDQTVIISTPTNQVELGPNLHPTQNVANSVQATNSTQIIKTGVSQTPIPTSIIMFQQQRRFSSIRLLPMHLPKHLSSLSVI